MFALLCVQSQILMRIISAGALVPAPAGHDAVYAVVETPPWAARACCCITWEIWP
ncbi:hypothetical protein LMG3431_05826 [Achromobacter pestifer]|uniref:Uncharacterized protein n=1 Tax=Achromobacter pestifer TaxID=1353889 RepID=A0A6S7A2M6_9BURK|nr:hypothetical protein LMG3431_05826 [Achromobacter pestifer]